MFFSRLGYHSSPGFHGEEAYARRIGRHAFPRFHLYVHGPGSRSLTLNLHLDQKRPSYRGSHAHAAEYDGSAVEAEAERIQQALTS
ncbi:MAG: hypothetical protein HYZ09_04390 [Candidatus Kerfeldbacteria bacterium]|nr:hypothetical protein [Candidatus Kerfeldbacteria bacterium]